jgi:hypothetical protein
MRASLISVSQSATFIDPFRSVIFFLTARFLSQVYTTAVSVRQCFGSRSRTVCRNRHCCGRHNYFLKGVVWGLDIEPRLPPSVARIGNSIRARLICTQDAFNASFVNRTFVDPTVVIDVFVDDGPHSLESMKKATELCLPLLAPDGIFIIEAVQHHQVIKISFKC